ncbi:lipopolysaccharide kinase InaA family protein [Halopseudomonas pelagia]|uniref:lipopolysaccharide kinase InaA family protein n=1 Tax=Halopseudomonas pelagia TaxID=553151 RepID=UPI00039FC797|nr:lipopolysaccharide kinase InaA family protein [Halopseudomonas pelagia]
MMPTTLAALAAGGRAPVLPALLATPAGEISLQHWLRVLPGKRLVAAGELNGRAVVVKLFISRSASRHAQRELDGLLALKEAGIATPDIVASGELELGSRFICTDYLQGSNNLQQIWDEMDDRPAGSASALDFLGQALGSIAAMHRAGLAQTDLHLGNFLLQGEQLYVIDGDAIELVSPGQPLASRQAEDNLAIFFAQLDRSWDEYVELLLIHYLQINAERALNPDRIAEQVRRVRAQRLADWLRKAVRDCSFFQVKRNWWRFSAAVRARAADLHPLLDAPDSPFEQTPQLKDGGSSSVTLTQLDSGSVVIKRYNIKGLGHWLSRFWRPSRAWHSWLAAQRLQFLRIPTPAPLAMIESRFGPLRRRAWLICEYCPGQNLLELFGVDGQIEPSVPQGEALLLLLRQLAEARISHGDFKATNLLWHDEKVWLIDLDGMLAHSSEAAWHQAWRIDRARLLRNWPASSPLARWLDAHLP